MVTIAACSGASSRRCFSRQAFKNLLGIIEQAYLHQQVDQQVHDAQRCRVPRTQTGTRRFQVWPQELDGLAKTSFVLAHNSQIEHVCDRCGISWAASLGVPCEAFAKDPFRAGAIVVLAQKDSQLVQRNQRVWVFGSFARCSVSATV